MEPTDRRLKPPPWKPPPWKPPKPPRNAAARSTPIVRQTAIAEPASSMPPNLFLSENPLAIAMLPTAIWGSRLQPLARMGSFPPLAAGPG